MSRTGQTASCAVGVMTCADGTWSACEWLQAREVDLSAKKPGLGPNGLGQQQECVDNPCDPFCFGFSDTPDGIDPTVCSGIDNNDGLTLIPHVGEQENKCNSVVVAPTPQTLTITSLSPLAPSTLQFNAYFKPDGCFNGVAPALWTLDKFDTAQISSNGLLTVVSPVSGTVGVTAYAGLWQASATANIVVNVVDKSAAPSGTGDKFAGAGTIADGDLTILYPYANTVFPLAQGGPLVQWRNNGVAATAIEIGLRYPADGSKFAWSAIRPELQVAPTTGLAAQPRAQIPDDAWRAFEKTARGDSGVITVQRYVGSVLRQEKTIPVSFATGQLKGTVYYQSYGTNLATNYCCHRDSSKQFGGATLAIKPNASIPTLVAGTNVLHTGCRVCHSVSTDGSRLITQLGESYGASDMYTLSNLTETWMYPQDGRFAWPALSPDGTYLFSNSGALAGSSSLPSKLYQVPSGTAIASTGLPSDLGAVTPAFSHDAKHVAFTWFSGSNSNPASLGVIDFDPATKTFSNLRKVYTNPNGYHVYWASFLPTNDKVVFQVQVRYNGHDYAGTRSDCDSTGTCNNIGTKAELWMVDINTKVAVRLDKANGLNAIPTGGNSHDADWVLNYEPTVNPSATGGYAWIVFTSRRLYGNVATINPWWSDPRFQYIQVEPTTKKLWVSAINLTAAAGTDPSTPAFYISGQELLAGNARGYWVLDKCKDASNVLSSSNACETNLDCCGSSASPPTAVCRLDSPLTNPPTRHCVPLSSQCVTEGNACTTNDQCCGFPDALCANGKCAKPPPVVSYEEATFVRDYVATCGPATYPVWREFQWKTETPSNSKIEFTVATADGFAQLKTATYAPLATVSGAAVVNWTGAEVTAALNAKGLPSKPYLRVAMKLIPSTDKHSTPIVKEWRQFVDCAQME